MRWPLNALLLVSTVLLVSACLADDAGQVELLDTPRSDGAGGDTTPPRDTASRADSAAPSDTAVAVVDVVPLGDTAPGDTTGAHDTQGVDDTSGAETLDPDTLAVDVVEPGDTLPVDTVEAGDTSLGDTAALVDTLLSDTVEPVDTVPPVDTAPAVDAVCVPATCGTQSCGDMPDGCGHTLACGGCTPPESCGGLGQTYVCGAPPPLPYPTRDGYQLKAIQPDFWPDKDNVSGNRAGGIAVNLGWWIWEPTPKAPPCGEGEVEFLNRCYRIDAGVEDQIRGYTDRGVRVTGIVYGSPAWARAGMGAACSPAASGFEIFCAPDDPTLFGRFAGMLAHRFNGLNGHGRVVDFVIWNEVNSNDWFDIGCGQGASCSTTAWIDAYAALWSSAYDHVIAQQPTAKVFYSFEHHFASSWDAPSAPNPVLGVETFITGMASRVGSRAWRVAYHPYPPNLLSPVFGSEDWPRVTYGNIGVLAGWLWKHYPGSVAARDIHLTESGVNSLSPQSSEAAQAQAVCEGFVNILGTPGVDSYIYHRMKDHPAETAAGLGLGLHDASGQAKQAWAVWALANRNDLNPQQLSCGFEHLPFTYLKRGYQAGKGHWVTSRSLPSGFAQEQDWRLLRDEAPSTTLLFACKVGEHNLLTKQAGCEGQFPLGPVGWIHDHPVAGTVPLFRCYVPGDGDHFVSSSATCEGQTVEQLLGYAVP